MIALEWFQEFLILLSLLAPQTGWGFRPDWGLDIRRIPECSELEEISPEPAERLPPDFDAPCIRDVTLELRIPDPPSSLALPPLEVQAASSRGNALCRLAPSPSGWSCRYENLDRTLAEGLSVPAGGEIEVFLGDDPPSTDWRLSPLRFRTPRARCQTPEEIRAQSRCIHTLVARSLHSTSGRQEE